MSVNLENFKFQTNSITGWESEEIKFGKEFTILLGGNGTGKTLECGEKFRTRSSKFTV